MKVNTVKVDIKMGIIIETKIDQYYKDQYRNREERLLIENPLKMSEGTKISVNNYDYQFLIIYLDEELKIKAFNCWLQGLTIKNDTYPYCIIYFRRVDNQAMDINEFADIGFEISDAENNEYDLHVNNTNVANSTFSIGGELLSYQKYLTIQTSVKGVEYVS